MRRRLCQLDEAGFGRPEAAGAIEGSQVRLEIDMQPLGAALPGNPRGFPDQLRGDALPAHVGVNAGVEKEGMNATIPGDIDEADEAAVVIGADMGKAAGQDAGEVRCLRCVPGGGPEGVEVGGRGEGVDAEFGHWWGPVCLSRCLLGFRLNVVASQWDRSWVYELLSASA